MKSRDARTRRTKNRALLRERRERGVPHRGRRLQAHGPFELARGRYPDPGGVSSRRLPMAHVLDPLFHALLLARWWAERVASLGRFVFTEYEFFFQGFILL